MKQLAEERGISKAELKDKTGYSINTIDRWITNKPPIIRADAKKVLRFMEIFGLSNWWEVFEPELYVLHKEEAST